MVAAARSSGFPGDPLRWLTHRGPQIVSYRFEVPALGQDFPEVWKAVTIPMTAGSMIAPIRGW